MALGVLMPVGAVFTIMVTFGALALLGVSALPAFGLSLIVAIGGVAAFVVRRSERVAARAERPAQAAIPAVAPMPDLLRNAEV